MSDRERDLEQLNAAARSAHTAEVVAHVVAEQLPSPASRIARQAVGEKAHERFLRYLALGFEKSADETGNPELSLIAAKLNSLVDEPEKTTVTEREWSAWPTQRDSLKHAGEYVDVRRVGDDTIVLTGRVVSYTDLLGSGGILQPHPERGMDYVTKAIRFPQDPREYELQMAGYEFSSVPADH